MMKNRLYWLAQIGGWTSYGIIVALATYANDPSRLNLKVLFNIFIVIAFFIILTQGMRHIYLKNGWLNMRPSPLIPRIIAISLIASIGITTFNLLYDFIFQKEVLNRNNEVLEFILDCISNLILIMFWNAVYFSYHFFSKSKEQELDNVNLEVSKNEFELKNLRSQLNPHFLFNSLNSIKALIDIEPQTAKSSITLLGQLMRSSLNMGKVTSIPLYEELDLVNNYLKLEKLRFEERLKVKFEIDDSMMNKFIPPFIIQTQVENAIKHGISERMDGGEILIRIFTENDVEFYQIENTGKLKNGEGGIGIENTIKRLELQYGAQSGFTISENGDSVLAQIKIKRA